MSRMTLEQICLANLEQKISRDYVFIYRTRENAYSILKQYTGQDFGYDVAAWRKWLKANKGKYPIPGDSDIPTDV